jgi:hypothetical protein
MSFAGFGKPFQAADIRRSTLNLEEDEMFGKFEESPSS